MRRALTFIIGAATGAAAAYFLDPMGGAKRRRELQDSATSTVRTGAGDMAESAKKAAGKARGAVTTAMAGVPGIGETPDDVSLANKVETEIFRPADAPKGNVSVNVENGIVFLRGEVALREWIERLEADALKVQGVKGVRNLLHLPGTPAPAAPATH
jgi:osmotically-inducible protein OsmY